MRPLLAIAVSTVILGGLTLFMQARPEVPPPPTPPARRAAEGVFTLEVTPSFSAVAEDDFALTLDDSPKPAALLVQLDGRDVIRRTENMAAGEPIRISPVPGVTEGENAFYLEAHPPLEDAAKAHALRVRILRDGEVVAEQTVWSEPGLPVQVNLPLQIAPAHAANTETSHDHDH